MAWYPLSTYTVMPLMPAASGDERNAAVWPTSSAVCTSRSGELAFIRGDVNLHLSGFTLPQRHVGIAHGHNDGAAPRVLDDLHPGAEGKAQGRHTAGGLFAATQLAHHTVRSGGEIAQRLQNP